MNLLNKLTLKNLKLNKKRTIVTIIGIVLSVALITAVATVYNSGIYSLVKYEKYLVGDYHVYYQDVPANEIDTFKNNKGVDHIYLTQGIGYASIESKNKDKPYAYINSFDEDALTNLSISIKEGRLPINDSEILVPTHLESNGGISSYKIGDKITLDVGDRITIDEEDGTEYTLNQDNGYNKGEESLKVRFTKTYTIVGIVNRPHRVIEPYSAPGYTFVTILDKNNLKGNYNVYTLYNKYGQNNFNQVTADLLGIKKSTFDVYYGDNEVSDKEMEDASKDMENAKYLADANIYLMMLESNPFDVNAVGSLAYLLMIVIAIIIVTSVFCIKNSFDISITEKIRQYGMLRSVGATKKQIRSNVFYEATILGLIGLPLGALLGLLASTILISVSNYFLKDAMSEGLKLYFSYSWIALLIALVLGALTIYLSAISSAIKAGRVSPIESIRNSANIKIKAKKLRTPKLITKLFGIGGEISYKNLKRSKKKYRTTVISIIVSVTVFIALSYFMNCMMLAANDEVFVADYDLYYHVDSYENDEIKNNIDKSIKVEGVEEYSIVRQTQYEIENPNYNEVIAKDLDLNNNENIYMYYVAKLVAVGKEEYKKYIKELGLDSTIYNKAILIDNYQYSIDDSNGKTIKRDLRVYDYKIGDKIKYSYLTRGNNIDKEIEIGYITKELPFGLSSFNETIFMIVSDDYYDKNIKSNLYDDEIFISVKDYETSLKVQKEIEEIFKDENVQVSNKFENAKQMENVIILVGIFLYGFIIVISLIGITNIFNTITTNMELRKREFATLQSVGMTRKEFHKMIRLESIFMGTKSLFFGILLGSLLSYLMYKVLYVDSPDVLFAYPIKGVIIAIIAVLIIIYAIMNYSIRKISKQNIIETIRNENI